MDSNREVVKTMAEEIVKAMNIIVDSNNRQYVKKQINNATSSSRGGSITTPINASQVNGLYNAVAGYIINAANKAESGEDVDQLTGNLITSLRGISAIEVNSIAADTVRSRMLYSAFGQFINLVAQKADLDEVDTEVIFSDID